MSTTKLKKNQNIYFICSGTSTNNIINSVNSINKNSSSFFDLFSKKIEKDKFSKLIDIGINELYMCQGNKINNKLFTTQLTKNNCVYTSLDYDCIESSFVLFSNFDKLKIYPLPYMSNETNIKNMKEFDIFKKKFGEYVKNTHEITKLKNYWKSKNLNNMFLEIKNTSSEIDWGKALNTVSSLNTYSFHTFKKNLEKIILSKYDKYKIFTRNIEDIDNIIFVCHPKLIEDMLKLFKKIRYYKNIDIIENSSIWELNLDLEFIIDPTNGKIKKQINYLEYNKIYPTEYNCNPLKYNDNIYKYKFNDKPFILFNSLKNIDIKYLKNIDLKNFVSEKRNIIKKKINANIIVKKPLKNENNNNLFENLK